MTQIKSELQTYAPVRGMLICQSGTGDYVSKAEAEDRHAMELQELKDKAIKAYISTCIENEDGVCCIDDGECPLNCHKVELFTQKLNEQ